MSTDKEFIEDFKRHAADYPQVSNLLTSSIDKYPQGELNDAKTFCKAIREGGIDKWRNSRIEQIVKITNPTLTEALLTRLAILEVIAGQYYYHDYAAESGS